VPVVWRAGGVVRRQCGALAVRSDGGVARRWCGAPVLWCTGGVMRRRSGSPTVWRRHRAGRGRCSSCAVCRRALWVLGPISTCSHGHPGARTGAPPHGLKVHRGCDTVEKSNPRAQRHLGGPVVWEILYSRANKRSGIAVRGCAGAVSRLHGRLGALETGHMGAWWPPAQVLRFGTQVA